MTEIAAVTGADGLWFVRRGRAIRGPYHWQTIEKELLLGRIIGSDEACGADGQWCTLQQVVDRNRFVSDDALAGRTPPQTSPKLPLDVAGEDENAHESGAGPGARATGLRLSPAVRARRARAASIWAGLCESAQPTVMPLLAVAGVLLAVTLLATLGRTSAPAGVIDCGTGLVAGGSWDYCSLVGSSADGADLTGLSARNARLFGASFVQAILTEADLSYADMSRADLTLVRLERARLVGTNLREAVLPHARLAGADLRYADLSGADLRGADLQRAQLGEALWTDGRRCARESIGTCVTAQSARPEGH